MIAAGHHVRVGALVSVGAVAQAALIVPVAILASLVHQRLHPTDDWFDIVGFGAGAIQVLMLPVVTAAVWQIGRRLELDLQRRYPTACRTCGYELSNSTGNTCPECGSEAVSGTQ